MQFSLTLLIRIVKNIAHFIVKRNVLLIVRLKSESITLVSYSYHRTVDDCHGVAVTLQFA
jgi:hypothetical protein